MSQPLILASASIRRRQLLLQLGIPFEVIATEATEVDMADNPAETVRVNARNKLDWCASRNSGRLILAADTTIDFNGRCIGKPSSLAEAADLFHAFSGNSHTVLTGIAMKAGEQDRVVETVSSVVTFKELTDAAIDEYFAQVDPLDKAGAYDINQAGDLIIESYNGSYTNIMGLPMETVYEWLKDIVPS